MSEHNALLGALLAVAKALSEQSAAINALAASNNRIVELAMQAMDEAPVETGEKGAPLTYLSGAPR